MKKKVMIVFGGESPEYEVSLNSASSIVNNIDHLKYEIILVGITKDGCWYKYNGPVNKIKEDTWFHSLDNCSPLVLSLSRNKKGFIDLDNNEIIDIDGVLLLLHGTNGEDGRIQGMLEQCNIPIIGCNALSSAICMNKKKAHQIVNSIGIKTAKSIVVRKDDLIDEQFDLNDCFSYPVFVKPVNSGSSFGLSKVYNKEELIKAIHYALEYDNEAVIEENISGIEVGCSIIGDNKLIVGEVDEVDLNGTLFDYNEKYTQSKAKINIPARFDESFRTKIKEDAIKIYKILNCSGFARVDLFIRDDGEIFFNEVNTIPGCTIHSRFPRMLEYSGLKYQDMITEIIESKI